MQFVVLRTGPAMDNPQMKVMMYIMPFMIMGFGTFLPAALSLYWVIGNFISVFKTSSFTNHLRKKKWSPKSRREKKMKKMTRRGATVEEAISAALKTLGVTRDQVEVEVIDKGKKGFLGFGAKEAEVTVTVTEVVELSTIEELAVPVEVENELMLSGEATAEKNQVESKEASEQLRKLKRQPSEKNGIIETEQYLKQIAKRMGINDLEVTY